MEYGTQKASYTMDFGASRLQSALSGQAQRWMSSYDPETTMDMWQGLQNIWQKGMAERGNMVENVLRSAAVLLLILVLCKLTQTIWEQRGVQLSVLTGALAISAACFGDLSSYMGLGKQTMEELNVFSSALLPVMASAAAASGAINRAGSVYTLTVIASNVLQTLATTVVFPFLYAYLAMALSDTVLGQSRLKRMRELLSGGIKTLLKVLLSAFLGLLTMTGSVSGTADVAARKAAKLAFQTMVPVVGGILSNASETLVAGASVMKAAIGTFGMLAIVSVMLLPFLKIGIYYLSIKLVCALGAMLDSGLCVLLEAVSTAMGFVLAMTASSAVCNLAACCCMVRMVTA